MTHRRAAVVTGPGTIDMRTLELGPLGPGDVCVQVAGCGLCGSNIPVWQGRPWFAYPLDPGAPGHEAWGTVSEVGGEVGDLRAGDPVALLSTDAFADTVVAPASAVVRLPAELAGRAFPGEALGCGFNVARRCSLRADDTVAVVGTGFLGLLVTRIAARAGARVLAIGRRREALEAAERMGAAEVIVMDDHQRILDAVDDLTGGRLCTTVVEAVGAQWPLDLAGALTAVGGRLVVAGYHQDGLRSVDMQLWNWRGIDVINAHERDRDVVRRGVQDAAAAVVDGWFDPSPLYTHTYPLESLDTAMNALVDRPEGFVKALVTT